MLPDKSPERALPYEADPVCEVAPLAFETVLTRAFWICRILKASLGSGWLWTVAVSSSSCPINVHTVALVKCFPFLGTQLNYVHIFLILMRLLFDPMEAKLHVNL